ncbi:hypothetical protein BCR36DRAFT_305078 [Piromyces finnis]|uniref:NEDD8-activating enzyme E1 catalytic subunit n=1 Tax=Piromyces finnis TaxID=1754191 RepID=A0A1Y1UXL3_9FUNG|nr:hypothetical protein BCR36DRAFT_305078 [Piromyces finnis]|eukprot:ORX43002.1 hypothetical protein BCR36DRAFT_305078 [Piromyces finnis]
MKDWNDRWSNINKYLDRSGPYTDPGFKPGEQVKSFLHEECKVLVIGAGGLGCELLKNLAMMGFKDIHVIDMDTIDVSNLNRQFLFRPEDINKSKAIAAAEFITKRVPGVKVTPYFGKIQDKDEEYYSQFKIIICGLDSVEARRWINATLVNLADMDYPETIKPLIDGGTEGFKGQARVILPGITACYECSLDMHTKPVSYPMCTIANTPRIPEHCIEYASVVEFPKAFPDRKVDTDSVEDLTWIYQCALNRANQFNIEGVTYQLTQGVVKHIIPSIASTNAIIAAACANEAFKIATNCTSYLNNYFMYMGDNGIYTHTFELDKKDNCPVCGFEQIQMTINPKLKLKDFIQMLMDKPNISIKKPSLATPSKALYMQAPKNLEMATRPNLEKTLDELVDESEEVVVTDPSLPISMHIGFTYSLDEKIVDDVVNA